MFTQFGFFVEDVIVDNKLTYMKQLFLNLDFKWRKKAVICIDVYNIVKDKQKAKGSKLGKIIFQKLNDDEWILRYRKKKSFSYKSMLCRQDIFRF